MWLWYDLLLGAWPLILANSMTLVLAGSAADMKWFFERCAQTS